MNKELIMKSDVLDILFENRNKNYGAYPLRKFYQNRLMKSLGLMIGSVLVLSAFTFLPKKKTMLIADIYVIPDTRTADLKEPEKKPEPPKEIIKQPQANQVKLVSKMVFVTNTRADTIQTLKPNTVIGNVTITTTVPGDPGPVKTVITGGGSTDPVIPAKQVVDRSVPLDNPEVMPSFPGGMDALRRFLQKNLTNPKDMEEGDLVEVKVRFVVGYDGKLQGFTVVQDGGEEFDREVIRVLKKMPEWIPGQSNGQNVSVYYNIPVKFVPAE